MIRSSVLVALTLFSSAAFAKAGDEEACVGLASGDACERADGTPGTCQPDTSDASILKCDDGVAASTDTDDTATKSGGCDVGGGAGSGVAVLGLLALRARRRR